MNDQSDNNTNGCEEQMTSCENVRAELAETREALDRGTYRLDTLDIELDIAQEELTDLESLTMAGVFSSLLGTKAGKMDALREQIRTLEQEQEECAKTVETLTTQVDQLTAELETFADQEMPMQFVEASEPMPSGVASPARDLECALDAGESLMRQLDGAFRSVNRIRRGPNAFAGGGAILATAMSVCKSRAATGVTSALTGSVRHFCDKLGQLPLGPDYLPDVCALLPRLQQFAEPAGLDRNADADVWAEFEVMVRTIVADLQEECARIEN